MEQNWLTAVEAEALKTTHLVELLEGQLKTAIQQVGIWK